MFGSHCLKTHSQTQETIALSSGESEFYGIAKAATMGIGIKSFFKDLGLEVEIQVNTDSSAARSISSRRGAGRVRRASQPELKECDHCGHDVDDCHFFCSVCHHPLAKTEDRYLEGEHREAAVESQPGAREVGVGVKGNFDFNGQGVEASEVPLQGCPGARAHVDPEPLHQWHLVP